MTENRKIYDPEFKKKAVLLSFERKAISQVAKELQINSGLLFTWREDFKKFGSGSFPGYGNLRLTPDQKCIHELEKKIHELDLRVEIIKSAGKCINQGRVAVFNFILENEKKYSIKLMCRALTVNRGTYRLWKTQHVSETVKKKIIIKECITTIYYASKERYGRHRIKAELLNYGYILSHRTIGKYMKELGFYVSIKK
ncbi:transposase-like protein [Flavobacterium sp. 2755]|uniref:transposase n=1 Tax=Flavobacterium sp. 2755 TaxID=2817765 RepID=UPI002862E084|nr:transposase [Flavobacterium sp. 2755]MDR6763664.1 transposase-like protein [Flavobacterium sp. 2755]